MKEENHYYILDNVKVDISDDSGCLTILIGIGLLILFICFGLSLLS